MHRGVLWNTPIDNRKVFTFFSSETSCSFYLEPKSTIAGLSDTRSYLLSRTLTTHKKPGDVLYIDIIFIIGVKDKKKLNPPLTMLLFLPNLNSTVTYLIHFILLYF